MSQESIQELCNMGFNSEQSKLALEQCDGNLERALDWLFSHSMDDQERENTSQSDSTGTQMDLLVELRRSFLMKHNLCRI